ncbi:hypothetical protein C8F01DRAFT_1365439 [Mycena amicta]|nr:hypothetical protein C8F01DRAFT_1365439 [Mycena amicta]
MCERHTRWTRRRQPGGFMELPPWTQACYQRWSGRKPGSRASPLAGKARPMHTYASGRQRARAWARVAGMTTTTTTTSASAAGATTLATTTTRRPKSALAAGATPDGDMDHPSPAFPRLRLPDKYSGPPASSYLHLVASFLSPLIDLGDSEYLKEGVRLFAWSSSSIYYPHMYSSYHGACTDVVNLYMRVMNRSWASQPPPLW